MPYKITGFRTRIGADFTLDRFIFTVSSAMCTKITGLGEGRIADCTGAQFLLPWPKKSKLPSNDV